VTVVAFVLALIAIFVAAKLFAVLAKRIGQPAVLGELIGGIIVGVSGFDIVDPHAPAIHLLAEIGVILLLFLIGLETDFNRLLAVGGTATVVAVVGVVLPFVGGAAFGYVLGLPTMVSVFLGASLTATSVGITARVLSDLGRLHEDESQVILGAAVVDDIIGLVILTIVSTVAALSSVMIIASFAAGLVLARTSKGNEIQRVVHRVGKFFIPIFFITVGAAIDVKTIDRRFLLIGLGLTVIGIAGKVLAGLAVPRRRGLNRIVIGVGMIPRGEVGLVFAQVGLTTTLLSPGLYSAVALMVMITTLVTPPALRLVEKPKSKDLAPDSVGMR